MTTATPALQTTTTCPCATTTATPARASSARATTLPAGEQRRATAEPAALTVTVVRRAHTTEFRLDGELEATTTPLLDCLVADALDRSGGDLSLDLAATSFCDVKGLNCLLATRRRVQARGGHLTILGTDRLLQRLLRVSGAADVIGSPS